MAFFNNNNYISLLSQMCQKWNVFRITNNLSLKISLQKETIKQWKLFSELPRMEENVMNFFELSDYLFSLIASACYSLSRN